MLYSFPPNNWDEVQRGTSSSPIAGTDHDVFDEEGVRFGLEGAPHRDRLDFPPTEKTLRHSGCRREGFESSTSTLPLAHQFLDSGAVHRAVRRRIYHVHVKDSIKRPTDGARSSARTSTSLIPSGEGTFVSAGHGDRRLPRTVRVSTESVTTGRSRSSGRTRAWTAMGGARRAGLRAQHRFRALDSGLRRRLCAGGARHGRRGGDRDRHAGLRLYGKPLQRYKTLPYHGLKPPYYTKRWPSPGRDEERCPKPRSATASRATLPTGMS